MLLCPCKSLTLLLLFAAGMAAAELPEVDRFNYILGTQAIGGKYQFSSQDPLIESAEAIFAVGASCMKFDLRP